MRVLRCDPMSVPRLLPVAVLNTVGVLDRRRGKRHGKELRDSETPRTTYVCGPHESKWPSAVSGGGNVGSRRLPTPGGGGQNPRRVEASASFCRPSSSKSPIDDACKTPTRARRRNEDSIISPCCTSRVCILPGAPSRMSSLRAVRVLAVVDSVLSIAGHQEAASHHHEVLLTSTANRFVFRASPSD